MTNSYENKAKARNVLNKVGYIISSFIQLIVNGVYYLFIIVSLITGCAIILLSTPFNILYFIGGVVEFIYKDETDIKRKELLKISYHDYYGRNGNNAFDSYFSYTTYNEHIYYVENGLPYYDKVLWTIPIEIFILFTCYFLNLIPSFDGKVFINVLGILLYIGLGNLVSYFFVKYFLKYLKLV